MLVDILPRLKTRDSYGAQKLHCAALNRFGEFLLLAI
jgi:hypothetical protein